MALIQTSFAIYMMEWSYRIQNASSIWIVHQSCIQNAQTTKFCLFLLFSFIELLFLQWFYLSQKAKTCETYIKHLQTKLNLNSDDTYNRHNCMQATNSQPAYSKSSCLKSTKRGVEAQLNSTIKAEQISTGKPNLFFFLRLCKARCKRFELTLESR